MMSIDFDTLNPLERQIHSVMEEHSKLVDTISITEAARLCGCSASKISKFCKKLGFGTYRQYIDYLYGKLPPEPVGSSELKRLAHFLDTFDETMVDDLVDLIGTRDKLLILGYGPSFYCAQYFEYRMKTCASKMVTAVSDELLVSTMTDTNTLVLVLTATGTFKSFDGVYRDTKEKDADLALIVEEYNPQLAQRYGKVFCLTDKVQPGNLKPFQKSRAAIFIFLEEVVRKLMMNEP